MAFAIWSRTVTSLPIRRKNRKLLARSLAQVLELAARCRVLKVAELPRQGDLEVPQLPESLPGGSVVVGRMAPDQQLVSSSCARRKTQRTLTPSASSKMAQPFCSSSAEDEARHAASPTDRKSVV